MPLTAKEKYLKRREQFEEKDNAKRALIAHDNNETAKKIKQLRSIRKNANSPLAMFDEGMSGNGLPQPILKKKKLYTEDMTRKELFDLAKELGSEDIEWSMTKDEMKEVLDGIH